MAQRRTFEEFEALANEKHNGFYTYNKATYVKDKAPMEIFCPIHGAFYQTPKRHLLGQGCPECGKIKAKVYHKHDYKAFIKRFNKKYGEDFDFPYIEKEYENEKSIITFICKKCGRIHTQKAQNIFANKYGCTCKIPKKEIKPKAKNKKEVKTRLIDCDTILNRIYDKYPTVEVVNKNKYKNTNTELQWKCLDCGSIFLRKPSQFLYGNLVSACPNCTKIRKKIEQTKTQGQFEQDVYEKYGKELYTIIGKYISSSDYIDIKCNDCGRTFTIEANSFLQGHGCPFHNCNSSAKEKEIFSFVKTICKDALSNDRKVLCGHELDVYIPSKRIAFEFDGLFWHNENCKPKNYHLNKTIECQNKNIRLIHIFEDEWRNNKNIWKSMINNVLGNTHKKIYARNCKVKEVDANISTSFLKLNHIQGMCPSSIKLGLYYKDELVSIMTFGKSRHFIGNGKCEYELLRFCNALDTIVVGGASKLFKHFIKMYNPKSVVSYADRRWSCGNLYNKLGFEFEHYSKPNYYYIIKEKRKNRFNFRKSILVKKYNCPINMSERDFCKQQKWYRIYDCGCSVYKWYNKTKDESQKLLNN